MGICASLHRLFDDLRLLREFLSEEGAGPQSASSDLVATSDDAVLSYGDLQMDTRSREVHRGERRIELTRTEYNLLELLLRNPRQVLTREVIFDRVWGFDFGPTSNTLSVYVGYLRRKTEAEGEPRLIHTIRGVGYMLRE